MSKYTVRDGQRSLQFDGELLAASSSKGDSGRWVEFELYRTASGQYVLSRVGVSNFVHTGSCDVVRRNGISPCPASDLSINDWRVCRECTAPPALDGMVYPEQPRYWAQAASQPESVLKSLYKYDADGTRYLTRVADRLLCDAAKQDPAIQDVYMTETID